MYDYSTRREKLQKKLARNGCDGLLINHRPNIRYLTGFTGEDAFLLVTRDRNLLVSDERFRQQITQECPDLSAAFRGPGGSTLRVAAKAAKDQGLRNLGVESDSIPLNWYSSLVDDLSKTKVLATSNQVESLREIKDRQEIVALRRSVKIAERAFAVLRAELTESSTELELAWAIESHIRKFGGEGCSFPPIVASGPRAALPHAEPTTGQIGEHPFLLVDWGATYDEYCSDLTRMIVVGKTPPKFAKIYKIVLEAQLAAIDAIAPGVPLKDIDAVARTVIGDAGYGKKFGHGLGHGIGLEIHEAPSIAFSQNRPLKPGMVVTIEPGIYLPRWGGIRIEDDILVTKNGHEVLTTVPSNLESTMLEI